VPSRRRFLSAGAGLILSAALPLSELLAPLAARAPLRARQRQAIERWFDQSHAQQMVRGSVMSVVSTPWIDSDIYRDLLADRG